MKYADARPLIRSGDLIAWGHDAWSSYHDIEVQMVRMFTRSEYAHVAVAWGVAGRLLVVEAVVPHVRIFPLSKLTPFYWLSGEIRNDWSPGVEELALSKVGESYSKWEAVKSFVSRVVPGSNSEWQCAELAAYLRAGLLLEGYESPTPATLVRSALQSGAGLVLVQV